MNDPSRSFSSVTALIIGDPHFKVSNIRETDAMVEAIIRTASERNPDVIIVLGDILDRHETIHVSPLTRSIKFLARLMNIAPTYILIGNHDLKNNRQFLSDEHPFSALKFWGHNIIVIDTTTLVIIKGKTFVFVPYVPPGRFEEALNKCPGWEQATCIFGHQEFNGAKMGAITSVEGDKWPLTYPYVVSGHIHDYQEPQVNILYTGTPIQHAFGDHHDKTISYFTFISPTERFHERIDLGLPRKHIVRLTCAQVSTYIPPSNCELKIIISGTSGDIKAIMKHHNINLWKQAGFKIAYKDIPLNAPDISQDIEVKSKAPPKFSTALYSAISSHQRLLSVYTRIFGSIKITTNPTIIFQHEPPKILTLNINSLTSNMSQLKITSPKSS